MFWAFSRAMTEWKKYAELNKIQRNLDLDGDSEAKIFQECEKIRKNYKKTHKDALKKHLKTYLK